MPEGKDLAGRRCLEACSRMRVKDNQVDFALHVLQQGDQPVGIFQAVIDVPQHDIFYEDGALSSKREAQLQSLYQLLKRPPARAACCSASESGLPPLSAFHFTGACAIGWGI